eukprot:scaffold37874_cov42-Cyclotella_meneghiniana.AAC.2
MQAWKDCFMLMLKTVFPNNAAEMQKFYLTLIRHSPKISVRAFLSSNCPASSIRGTPRILRRR